MEVIVRKEKLVEPSPLSYGKLIRLEVSGRNIFKALRDLSTEFNIAYLSDERELRKFVRHTNPGKHLAVGGWKEETDEKTTAIARDNAWLGSGVILANRAMVSDNAVIDGNVTIAGFAKIRNNAVLKGSLLVTDYADISGNYRLEGTGQTIGGNTRLY